MNFQEIRSEVYQRTQDPGGSRWPITYYKRIANNAYLELCRDLRLPRDYAAMTAVASRQYLVLPTFASGQSSDAYSQGMISDFIRVLFDDERVEPMAFGQVHDITGDTWDTTTGDPIYYWIETVMEGAGHAITAVSTTNETFTIAGDWTQRFRAGVKFSVSGSTGNNKTDASPWEVSSSTYSTSTVITVTGDITNATADGTIYLTNRLEQRMMFYPTPSSAGTVKMWFVRRPPLLTNDNQIPELPLDWHELIVENTVRRVWEILGKMDKYMLYTGLYREHLRDARGVLAYQNLGGEDLTVIDG